MSNNTKLHILLAGRPQLTPEECYDAADYLVAHCSVDELLRLCILVGRPFSTRPATGRVEKVSTAEALLGDMQQDCSELLPAWDIVLTERIEYRKARAEAIAQLSIPSIDSCLEQSFRVLSAGEIAALYLGFRQRQRVLYEQLQAHHTRAVAQQLSLTRDLRARLDNGFRWLVDHDPELLRRITAELRLGADGSTQDHIRVWERELARAG